VHDPPIAHVDATVVVVVGATVVVVGATVVVVGATVVVVGATVVVVGATVVAKVIVFLEVLAGYLLDLAIFNVNVHEPLTPIVSIVGFLNGVNVHEPLLDQVFTPGEFVETRVDNLFFSPLFNEETFQVTVVDDAASATPPAHNTPANNTAAIPTRPNRFITLSCSETTKHVGVRRLHDSIIKSFNNKH
jgi:hypothetical protein